MASSSQKRRKIHRADGSAHYVSDNMVAAIVARLEPKDLLRFQCVSKSWCALISHPSFVAKGFDTERVCFLTETGVTFLSWEKNNNGDGGYTESIVHYAGHIWNGDWKFCDIAGSCNGLICLILSKTTITIHNRYSTETGCLVWNPSTRVSSMLPRFDNMRLPNFYGLGYDSATDDYKVVLGYNSEFEQKIAVFSLKAGSWRTLDFSHVIGSVYMPRGRRCFSSECFSRGCLLNGTVHWVYGSNFLTFSAGEEKVEMMPFSKLCKEHYFGIQTGTIEDCLAVFLSNFPEEDDVKITIWVMKEYGVDESWTKLIQVPSEYVSQSVRFLILPLAILKNGDILINMGYLGLALYSPNKKTHRIVFKGPLHSSMGYCGLALFSPTVVSPKPRLLIKQSMY